MLVRNLVFIAERILWIHVGIGLFCAPAGPEKVHQWVCMPGRTWGVFAWWREAGAGSRNTMEKS